MIGTKLRITSHLYPYVFFILFASIAIYIYLELIGFDDIRVFLYWRVPHAENALLIFGIPLFISAFLGFCFFQVIVRRHLSKDAYDRFLKSIDFLWYTSALFAALALLNQTVFTQIEKELQSYIQIEAEEQRKLVQWSGAAVASCKEVSDIDRTSEVIIFINNLCGLAQVGTRDRRVLNYLGDTCLSQSRYFGFGDNDASGLQIAASMDKEIEQHFLNFYTYCSSVYYLFDAQEHVKELQKQKSNSLQPYALRTSPLIGIFLAVVALRMSRTFSEVTFRR